MLSQLEQAGAVIFQTLAGLAMDKGDNKDARGNAASIQHLLEAWLASNVLQFLAIAGLHYLERRRRRFRHITDSAASSDNDAASLKAPRSPSLSRPRHWDVGAAVSTPEDERVAELTQPLLPPVTEHASEDEDGKSNREIRRGEIFSGVGGGMIVFAWALFMTTAWLRLRTKAERGHSS